MAMAHVVKMGKTPDFLSGKRVVRSVFVAASAVYVAVGCGGQSQSSLGSSGGLSSVGGENSAGGTLGMGGNSAIRPTGGTLAAGGALPTATGGIGQGSTGGARPVATGGNSSATAGAQAVAMGGNLPAAGGAGLGGNSTAGAQVVATGGNSPAGGGAGLGGNPTGGAQPIATGGVVAATAGAGAGGNVTGGASPGGTGGRSTATGGTATGGAKPTGGNAGMSTSGSSVGGGANAGGPCDIYAAATPPTPCVAAYSTVRSLNSLYKGPLYQVRKVGSGGGSSTHDISADGGFSDSATQDSFCGADACTISIIYDQSGKGNDLKKAPPDCYLDTNNPGSNESDAKGRSLKIGGHNVYALYMVPRDGYRNNQTTAMPIKDDAQGIYEVVDGTRFSDTCCWDFGNGSIDNCIGPNGQSNALFFGTGYWGKGADNGPWFMGDFGAGVWAGGSGVSGARNLDDPSTTYDFAMGILKTNATNYAIRVGNGQSGDLVTAYDGALPFPTWSMKGGIVLGLGQDGSNASSGTFFEGAITSGRPSDATDAAVLANVQAANYGQ
jgi:hypothetical protein